jgi:hypothetical protein
MSVELEMVDVNTHVLTQKVLLFAYATMVTHCTMTGLVVMLRSALMNMLQVRTNRLKVGQSLLVKQLI